MFKKFDGHADVTSSVQLKSSAQRTIRNRLVELYPPLESYINQILPKNENFKTIKCKEHVEVLFLS